MGGPVGRGIVVLGMTIGVVVVEGFGITIGVGIGFDPGMGGGPKGGCGSGGLGTIEMAVAVAAFVGWTESAATVCSSNIPPGGVSADEVGDVLLAIAAAVATAAAAAAILGPARGGEGFFNVGMGRGFSLLFHPNPVPGVIPGVTPFVPVRARPIVFFTLFSTSSDEAADISGGIIPPRDEKKL